MFKHKKLIIHFNRKIVNLKVLIIFLFILISSLPVNADAPVKKIHIQGSEIFNEETLIEILDTGSFRNSGYSFLPVNAKLKSFYKESGYPLARIYLIDETESSLSVYIDEGKIGQIRIAGFDDLKTAAVKLMFKLPHKIYNPDSIDENIIKIRRQLKIDIQVELLTEEDYDKAFFQLDKEFKIPFFGETKLPFFEKYGYRYNLVVTRKAASASDTGSSDKKRLTFDYGMQSNVISSHTPWISATVPYILNNEDLLKLKFSLTYNYRLQQYETLPSWAQNKLEGQYYPPGSRFYKKFTPRTVFSIIQSGSSRADIGIEKYDFVLFRGIIEPGLALLPDLRLYTGFGIEKDNISNYSLNGDFTDHDEIHDDSKNWYLITANIELSEIFWYLEKNDLVLKISSGYYFNSEHFYETATQINKTFFPSEGLRYFTGFQFKNAGMEVPFYHDPAVNDYYFRGQSFSQHHSLFIISNRNDFNFSLYKDYVNAGFFLDFTAFRGYGINLKGFQYGAAGGPKTDFLLFDQIEFSLLIGYDYLLENDKFKFMMNFSFNNKW
ncbi:MAG: hypothetical protein JW982_11340 [Spirochaetes bacterium]|nr:hypothetical protein [Spirochaetota bacterium]